MSKYSELVDHFLRGMGLRIENRGPAPDGVTYAQDHIAIGSIFQGDADRLRGSEYQRDMEAIRMCGKTYDGRTADDIRREQERQHPKGQGRRKPLFVVGAGTQGDRRH